MRRDIGRGEGSALHEGWGSFMANFEMSSESKKKSDGYNLPCPAKEYMRRKAVKAVKNGKRQIEVAKLFGVSRQAVSHWVRLCRQGGEEALKARPRGRPKGSSLPACQAAELVKILTEYYPDQLNLPFYLWSPEALSQLIEKRFGLRLSGWTVSRYLVRWGFKQQEPVRRKLEKTSLTLQYWFEEAYPEILKRAKNEKACIYWGDELDLNCNYSLRSIYEFGYQSGVISCISQALRRRVISAMTNRGQLRFMVSKNYSQPGAFLEFLRRLVLQSPGKLFLIASDQPVHIAERIKGWAEENTDRIRLYFLPIYEEALKLACR
jgi:transposase